MRIMHKVSLKKVSFPALVAYSELLLKNAVYKHFQTPKPQ